MTSGNISDSACNEILPFAIPDFGSEELAEVTKVLKSGWLTTGPVTRRFEAEFAAAVGAKFAVAVNSCTAAMHLALEAIGLRAGDEVITTPYTFAATAEVVRYFQAKPVFVDVEADTLNINPELIEQAITSKTKAIIPVHFAGIPANLDAITAIAQRHQLRVIEDAAHAFPSTYHGRMIGSISDFTCFSFYATKTITTGEGGMICTDNASWADRCRIMSMHGISRDAWKRYTAEGSWYYEIEAAGYKYNLSDLAASLGIAQLNKAQQMRDRRAQIAASYSKAFQSQSSLQTPVDDGVGGHAWHLYPLRFNLDQLDVDRGQIVELLKKKGILCSVHFIPLHIHPYYRREFGYQPSDFPVAYQQYMREVSLPIYSAMSDADVNRVIESVVDLVATHSKVSFAKKLAA